MIQTMACFGNRIGQSLNDLTQAFAQLAGDEEVAGVVGLPRGRTHRQLPVARRRDLEAVLCRLVAFFSSQSAHVLN